MLFFAWTTSAQCYTVSVELSSSFGKRQKTLGPWLILLKLNILLEPATQTTSHGIIPEIEEEVAAAGTIGLFEHKIRVFI